ncbi:MAG: putative oxidoreductase [Psychromonas sp.]|jgi:putative oxidoreductase|uniref:hypothetical protein n=1 Tax=Psychromonas sp. TaxID=1884585 RepID=UPI0039E61E02
MFFIFGIYTRLASTFVIGTCLFVIGLMHMGDFFTVDRNGAWAVESVATYLFAALSILFLGSGKYALRPNP